MPEPRPSVSPPSGALPSWGLPRRRFSPLARDIVIALVVKAIVLYGLWYAFFRTPTAPGMKMETLAVEERLIAPIAPSEPGNGR